MNEKNRNHKGITRQTGLLFVLGLLLLAALAIGGTALAQGGRPGAVPSGFEPIEPVIWPEAEARGFNAILYESQAISPFTTISGKCLLDVSQPPVTGNMGCTANDVSLTQAGEPIIIDPCDYPGDTTTFTTQFQIGANASQRYDIGIYFATDGGGADGAKTGLCSISSLDIGSTGIVNLDGATDTGSTCGGVPDGRVCVQNNDCTIANSGYTTCNSVGSHPDTCGDIASEVIAVQTLTLTAVCVDNDNDGTLNVPYCTAWSNSTGALCRFPNQAIPENSSKCNCQTGFEIPIRVPPIRMDIEKTASLASAPPGGTFTYTLQYANRGDNNPNNSNQTVNNIITDTLPPELALMSFAPLPAGVTCTYEKPIGTAVPFGTYGGTIKCLDLGPLPEDPNFQNPKIIQFTVMVDPTPTQTQTVANTACVEGTAQNPPTPPASPTDQDCSTINVTTPVTVVYFNGSATTGGIRFDWSTATESGNAGFNLYVRSDDGYTKLNERLIRSSVVDSMSLTDYSYEIDGAPEGDFYIEDVALDGTGRYHGPFILNEPYGERVEPELIDWESIAAESAALAAERATTVSAGSDQARTSSTNSLDATSAIGPLEFRVKESGIYRVTYEQIKAAGVDLLDISGNSLALTHKGIPVAIYVSASKFGPGAYIEFYGEGLDTLYTDTNVYRLEVNSALASRVAISRSKVSRNAVYPSYYMETTTVEKNNTYYDTSPGDDPWIDTFFYVDANYLQKYQSTLTVDNYVAGAAPSTVFVNLWGREDMVPGNEHRVLVSMNATQVADYQFKDRDVVQLTAQLPNGLLKEGANAFALNTAMIPGVEYNMFALESFGLNYPRAFKAIGGRLDFTAEAQAFSVTGLSSNQVLVYRLDAGRPTRLNGASVESDGAGYRVNFVGGTNATYYVTTASSVLTPEISKAAEFEDIKSGTAEYLVIAHPNFRSGLKPFVDARSSLYDVKVVDVTQVYAQYSGGVFDPQAIRDYIRHAINVMGVDYVLLVGGDTYDYRRYSGSSISFIPSLYMPSIGSVGFAPVDPLFTDVNGDNIPDKPIGRFPVLSVEELNMIVAKTVAYDANTNPLTALFAADAGFQKDSETFVAAMAQARSDGWDIERAYINELGLTDAKTKLIQTMAEGPRLASFVGHSNQYQWTLNRTALLHYADAQGLKNSTPMVVTQWGCYNTYYVDPAAISLGHKFLLSGLNGAAAVAGSTTITNAISERELGERMMPLMTSDGMTIGDAMQTAKKYLSYQYPEMVDVLLGWTILGDPTLMLQP